MKTSKFVRVLGVLFFAGIIAIAYLFLARGDSTVPANAEGLPAAEVGNQSVTDSQDTELSGEPAMVNWMQVQVAKFVSDDPIEADGLMWELPFGTYLAVTTENGRYEGVESAEAGGDAGWCGEDQYDCPPHAVLVRVEVPEENYGCLTAAMDISWRIRVSNTCGVGVPVRFTLRTNDQTRHGDEILQDYLALAGLELPFRAGFESEVGIFVAAAVPGDQVQLTYAEESQWIGYSCWDCLADSTGPGETPFQLFPGEFGTFGEATEPLGSALNPGVVFQWVRPDGSAQTLGFEVLVPSGRASTVWIGRWDVPVE